MNQSKIRTKGQIGNTSVWEMIDLSLSQHQHGRLKDMIATYNRSRPVTTITDSLGRRRSYHSGCLRGNQCLLIQDLMYLCLTQLEALRRSVNSSDQRLFSTYLQADCLPVLTNRRELAAKLKANGVRICRNSIYNHLRMLEDAGIILRRRHTSRQRVTQEDGTVVYETCANGRGDFQLYLSKQIFAFRLQYAHLAGTGAHQTDEAAPGPAVDNPPGAAAAGEKAAIENQPLSQHQSQKLGQIIPTNSETEEWDNNNSGKVHCDQSGVPLGHKVDDTGRWPQPYLLERNSKIPPDSGPGGGEIRPAGAPAAALDARARLQRQRELSERRRALSALVAAVVPDKERDFYLKMLRLQLIGMLYPDLSPRYVRQIEDHLHQLLALYLDLIGESPRQSFRKLSRAVEMVYLYRRKHPGHRLYDPLHYLRMDYQGGFIQVVQKWLPREELRLRLRAEKKSRLLQWQKARAYTDDLFDGTVEALRSGLYQSRALFAEAQKRLNGYLGRIRAPQAMRERLRASLTSRFEHIAGALVQEAKAPQDLSTDDTWRSFLVYLDGLDTKGEFYE